eukprot:Lithocolla_globosa_v1_NODE_6440_length_1087_cov_3.707364.p1 type:complete len:257 gc:universal NODE_6440_length_1087_cov_3.707364:2-772(+)
MGRTFDEICKVAQCKQSFFFGIEKMIEFVGVIDFEASCDTKEQMNRGDMEIIEFPIVLLHLPSKEIVSEFHYYIQTSKYPLISTYCVEKTGITQTLLDSKGISFQHCMQLVLKWLEEETNFDNTVMITCGKWDLGTQLPRQCQENGVVLPETFRNWVNVKEPFKEIFPGFKKAVTMSTMLKTLSLPLVGKHHSGLDDSRNIAKIVLKLVELGLSFSIEKKEGQTQAIFRVEKEQKKPEKLAESKGKEEKKRRRRLQ